MWVDTDGTGSDKYLKCLLKAIIIVIFKMLNNSMTLNVPDGSSGVFPLSFLLEFGAFLDTSADARQLSAVFLILPTNIAHLPDTNRGFNVEWHLKY